MDRQEVETRSRAATAFAEALGSGNDRAFMQFYIAALNLADRMLDEQESDRGAAIANLIAQRALSPEALGGQLRTIAREDGSVLYSDPVWAENALRIAEGDTRVIGGVDTDPRDFVDCFAIGSPEGWCCTGTLVATNVVVTAAHCVRGECCQRVFIGPDVDSPTDGAVVNVEHAEMYPEYNPTAAPYHDVAVLILADDVQGVAPRTIASPDALEGEPSVRIVGYGTTNVAGTAGYGRRRQVDVPLASNDLPLGQDPTVEFVAGQPLLEKDSCNGDSGGPAYVERDGEWLLMGSTSRGVTGKRNCGDGGIYTRVPEFATWIRSVDGGHWS
jgi:secreted trypsin-like serine protease